MIWHESWLRLQAAEQIDHLNQAAQARQLVQAARGDNHAVTPNRFRRLLAIVQIARRM